jgi:hypothetical protein
MIDLAIISGAISAATSAVALFDKICDQVERFITNSPDPMVPISHRMKIVKEDDTIVSLLHGKVVQRITADDLKKLPESQLKHVTVIERSMEYYCSVWELVYPSFPLSDPVENFHMEWQLKGIIREIKGNLDGILSFLESCGLQLDDHYRHIRHLVQNV